MAPIAVQNGSTNTSSIASVITATASERRPQSARSTLSISGHVATTTIVAQITGARNGRRIHSEAMISTPMKSTASVVRVTSLRIDGSPRGADHRRRVSSGDDAASARHDRAPLYGRGTDLAGVRAAAAPRG